MHAELHHWNRVGKLGPIDRLRNHLLHGPDCQPDELSYVHSHLLSNEESFFRSDKGAYACSYGRSNCESLVDSDKGAYACSYGRSNCKSLVDSDEKTYGLSDPSSIASTYDIAFQCPHKQPLFKSELFSNESADPAAIYPPYFDSDNVSEQLSLELPFKLAHYFTVLQPVQRALFFADELTLFLPII